MNETEDPRPSAAVEPPPFAPHQDPEDMTILARWLQRAMEQGPIFWALLGGLAVVLAGLGAIVSSLSAADSANKQAWFDSIRSTTPEDQIKIAEKHPKTPVGDWSRLQAGYEEYQAGSGDLTSPGRRESAGPRLKRALDLFRQVATEAPKESPQGREAAFAVARVYETRNELPEAIKQYRLVAEQWPDSPEARESLRLAKALEDPANIQFYKELYAAKLGPAEAPTIPADAPPPPPTIDLAPGKGVDLKLPGTSAAGKSFLPGGLGGPAPADLPPPATTPAPAIPTPDAKPESTPAPAPAPESKAPAPASAAQPAPAPASAPEKPK